MYRCKRLLVALGLNDQDVAVIRYADMVSRVTQPENLVFIHVVQKLDIPSDIREKYPQLVGPDPDFAREQMEQLVQQHWDGPSGLSVQLQVAEGCPVAELLRCSIQPDTDLCAQERQQVRFKPWILLQPAGVAP